MLVETEQMIPITKLQKELTQTVRKYLKKINPFIFSKTTTWKLLKSGELVKGIN